MKFLLFIPLIFVFANAKELLIAMPGIRPEAEDEYLCHQMDVSNETFYITAFKPKADGQHAHHMILFACSEPGSKESVWNCGEMKTTDQSTASPTCKSGFNMVYSWAMNAPGFVLPEDVSFEIGKNTGKLTLVLQVHYKDVDFFRNNPSLRDTSGVSLVVQKTPTKKTAGLYVLVTGGYIPPKSTVFMEAACTYNGKAEMHPFAFRTHTHGLGRLVTGFVIHDKDWTEIGQKNPQEEQMFYKAQPNVVVKPGDDLAARCVMENNGTATVRIGSTRADEMCNFYFMYWVDRKDSFQITDAANNECFTEGWPNFKWEKALKNIRIPISASMIKGSHKIYKEMVKEMRQNEQEMENMLSEMFGNNDQERTDESDDFSDEADSF